MEAGNIKITHDRNCLESQRREPLSGMDCIRLMSRVVNNVCIKDDEVQNIKLIKASHSLHERLTAGRQVERQRKPEQNDNKMCAMEFVWCSFQPENEGECCTLESFTMKHNV